MTAKQWMPLEQWEALVRGEGCPLCAEVRSEQLSNAYGYTIADLPSGRLRLAANQAIRGYCILIYKLHVTEPYRLPTEERTQFFEDVMRVGRALDTVFTPLKMNFEILGNAIPHLHCHIKPRYYGDPAPHAPLSSDERTVLLSPEEYEERVKAIREVLSQQ